MKRILGVAMIALLAGTSCGKSTGGGPNNENNENNENNPNNPTAECQSSDVDGEVDGRITADTTYCGLVLVTGSLYNTGSHTITARPGTVFRFAVDKGMEFGWASNEATVKFEGTADKPIIFEGTTPERGHWEGITITNSVTSDSVFEHVIIRHAGGDGAALKNRSERGLTFKNILIEESANAGMASSSFRAGSENVSVRNSAGPAFILTNGIGVTNFPLGGTHEGVENNYVEVDFDRISVNQIWRNPGIPYVVKTSPYNNAEVEIDFEAGIEFIFRIDKGMEFGWASNEATVRFNGTEEAPIKMRGFVEEPGHWKGIKINGSVSTASLLKHVEIRHAGQGSDFPLALRSAITINDVTLSENEGAAIFIDDQGLRNGSANLNIDNDSGASAEVHSTGALTLPLGGSYGSGSAYVELINGRMGRSGTLSALNVPYRVKDTIYNNAEISLIVETGTVILFAPDTHIEMGWASNSATFQADGIEMRGANSSAGDWNGFRWSASVNNDSYLRNSTISHANDFGIRIGRDNGADITGNTIDQTTGYCIEKRAADTTDYAAANTLNCTMGAIKP